MDNTHGSLGHIGCQSLELVCEGWVPRTFWLPRRGSTSSNTGTGVGFVSCGTLTGILYLHTHKDYTSSSFVIHFVIWQLPIGLGISVSVWSSLDAFAGDLPFETLLAPKCCLTQAYNLVNLCPSYARVRLLSVPSSNRPFSYRPSLYIIPGEGRVIELDYAWCRLNGSADIHIFRNYVLIMVWYSTCFCQFTWCHECT